MIPLTISFHGMDPSEALDAFVREEVSALERFFPRVLRCRVVIEQPHRHHRSGAPLRVRIDLHLPGQEIVVDHQPTLHAELQRAEADEVEKSQEVSAPFADAPLAVRAAFRAARRRLQDEARHLQGAVKTHELPAVAHVTSILRDEGYGFLETPDGREIYFHANSVLNDAFDALKVGDTVRFAEEAGDNGPQASTVSVLA